MPILSFTPSDALATLMLPAGDYDAQICRIEAKPSKEKTSTHYFTDIRIIQEGPYKEKEIRIVPNSNTKGPSLLPGFGYMVPTSVFLEINAAVTGEKVSAVSKNVDTESLVDKPMKVTVAVVPGDDGKLYNIVTAYRPIGSTGPVW